MKIGCRWLAGWLALVILAVAFPLGIIAEEEGIPTYELVRFSDFERVYSEETGRLLYGDTLYADWTRADGIDRDGGYDVQTDYPERENLRLKITMELTSSEEAVDPDTAWESFTVKLRSPDVENKEGDPNLEINGGNDETNHEHNYGWNIKPDAVNMENGRLELSIPLDRPADTSRGLMDWTMVQRIILTLRIKDELVDEGLAPTMTMTLSEVRIVNDIMQITRDEILQVANQAFPEKVVYHPDSLAAFAETRQQALALVADETTTLQQLQEMAVTIRSVRDAMVEITYMVADFSRLCGTYPGEDTHTLYADWVYARETGDGVGVDVTPHERGRLMLQLEFTLTGPEGYDGVWNTDGWVLLRSADTDKACTYGFRLAAQDTAIGALKSGVNRLSIPLDATAEDGYTILQSAENEAGTLGTIDWTAINRMQLYIAPESYQKGDFTLTVTMARIVDVTQPTQALEGLTQALGTAVKDQAAYTAASWEIYATARQAAEAAQAGYVYYTAEELTAAATALTTAAAGLEEKPPYTLGDVDADGGVTANDALQALQAATGKITLSDTAALAAEVDGEANVSASDALLILQYATKKIISFPMVG